MTRKALFGIAFLGALVSACMHPTAVQPEAASSIRRLGVVSLLPTTFYYNVAQTSQFERFSARAHEFSVGELLNEAARSGVELSQRRTTRRVVQIHDEITNLRIKYYEGPIVWSAYVERIRQELAGFAVKHDVDAILVIAKGFDPPNAYGIHVALYTGPNDAYRTATIRPDILLTLVDRRGERIASKLYVQGYRAPSGDNNKAWDHEAGQRVSVATHRRLVGVMAAATEIHVSGAAQDLGLK